MRQTMHHQFDNIASFGVGLLVWFVKFWYNLNISGDSSSKIVEQAITAGLCGFAAMVGKELYLLVKKSFFKKKNKTNNVGEDK